MGRVLFHGMKSGGGHGGTGSKAKSAGLKPGATFKSWGLGGTRLPRPKESFARVVEWMV
jgi:hypothetical protein